MNRSSGVHWSGKVVTTPYPKMRRFPSGSPLESSRVRVIGAQAMARLGRKATGRELDGRTWDEFPCP